ncbi:DUF2490 domain-containing protein [Rubellicoccus peritrichatus]|uniref:DUF2490 domain-containing protein n=1 Tax=Rubellicoccus peritrichatus TaxID=3080537 RepID=A0AAQ3LFV8_9BACT|nr:DUF2490 domain-containing protein [Puniceicoccus sp. CR14]WOO41329.1 DUF2490 domain-containing protein [Puniceicoccus sp. CR14]
MNLRSSLQKLLPSVVFAIAGLGMLRASDWELWMTFRGDLEFTDQLGGLIEVEERIRDDFTDPYLTFSRQGIYWNAEPWLRLGANYLYSTRDTDDSDNEAENRVEFRLTFRHQIEEFRLSMRNQFDSRFSGDSFQERYRIRLQAIRPLFDVSDRTLSVFGANEFFFDLSNGGEYRQNRLTGGFAYDLGPGIRPVIYYRYRSLKISGQWVNFNVLGVMMRVQF